LIDVIQYMKQSGVAAAAAASGNNKEAKSDSFCEFCNKETQTYCNDCAGNPLLCEDCFTNAHKSDKRKNHKLVNISERSKMKCREHDEENLKLFCFSCQRLICVMCAQFSDNHRKHKILTMKEAASTTRDKLGTWLEKSLREQEKVQVDVLKLRHKVMDMQIQEVVLARRVENLTECAELVDLDDVSFLLKYSTAMEGSPPKPDVDSSFLDEKQIDTLREWIGADKSFVLLYRGSRDGRNTDSFHRCCNNKGATLTVLKTTNGNIFGGYVSQPWQSRNNWVSDTSAWLFTLKNSAGVGPTKINRSGNGNEMYDHVSYMPTFGSNHDLYCGDANGNSSSSTVGNSYSLTDSRLQYLDGSQQFSISEIEVFGFEQ